jgi:hypothetical protein
MSFALGLFILSLAGAEGPESGAASRIAYDVRVIKIDGLEWRGRYFGQLQAVTSHGGGSVWTASRQTAARLAELDPNGLTAPRITAAPRAVAHLTDRTNRKVASGLTRLADGPFDHATQVAYAPHYEAIREGLALTITGRRIDQGVLACVALEETRVAAVHHVPLCEAVGTKACCDAEAGPQACAGKIASRIEVPEVAHAALVGEWLIPNDGALVASLGVRTTADEAGWAVVSERLVLIEASAPADGAIEPAVLERSLPDILSGRLAPPRVDIPMPMPAMPSHSLPQALGADGTPLPLPPLPESPPPPSSLPGSEEPCASPQKSTIKAPEPTTLDAASNKTGFVLPAWAKLAGAPGAAQAPAAGSDPARALSLRFPIDAGNLHLEVEVRMTSPVPVLDLLRSAVAPQTQPGK